MRLKEVEQDFPCGPVSKTHTPNAGILGLIPAQETDPMLQLVHMPQPRPGTSSQVNIKEMWSQSNKEEISREKEQPVQRS